jgi:myosin heavy subunit
MSGLGEEQSELNKQSRELAKRLSEQMRLSAGDQAEMRRLAQEQARIRSELQSLQDEEAQRRQLLGRLDETRRDMQAVEEQLREGQPGGDLEERQNRILSRMLDAARSLNRRDYDPERESRTGADLARPSPAALPASLLRENDRLRFDLLKAEADRYPAQYRAFIESYLQRLNGSPR